MGTAASITVIATLAVAVAFLRIRREKLSPALRREYAELARWADRETTLITHAYARQDAERADAAEGDAVLTEVEAQVRRLTVAPDQIARTQEKPPGRGPSGESAMFSPNVRSRLRHLGWEDRPLSIVLASILIRARRAGIEESADCQKRPSGSHAERILRMLDLAEARGRLPAMTRDGCLVPEEDPARELVDRR